MDQSRVQHSDACSFRQGPAQNTGEQFPLANIDGRVRKSKANPATIARQRILDSFKWLAYAKYERDDSSVVRSLEMITLSVAGFNSEESVLRPSFTVTSANHTWSGLRGHNTSRSFPLHITRRLIPTTGQFAYCSNFLNFTANIWDLQNRIFYSLPCRTRKSVPSA